MHSSGPAPALATTDQHARGEGGHVFVLLEILSGFGAFAVYGFRSVVPEVVWVGTGSLEDTCREFVFLKNISSP